MKVFISGEGARLCNHNNSRTQCLAFGSGDVRAPSSSPAWSWPFLPNRRVTDAVHQPCLRRRVHQRTPGSIANLYKRYFENSVCATASSDGLFEPPDRSRSQALYRVNIKGSIFGKQGEQLLVAVL